MPLSYANAYDVANDTKVVQRVTIAAIRQAIVVAAENPATAGHAGRLALATAVLNSPTQYGPLFAYVATSDASAKANMTDAEVLAVVAAAWNGFAGV